MMSPGWTPLTPSTPMPHSSPCRTSRTSSLKRLREAMVFSPSRVSPRLMRTRAVLMILPSITAQPKIFPISKVGTNFGCAVIEGKIIKTARVRIKRGDTLLGESTIATLKRFKDDVREVLQGLECGIGVEGIKGVQPGDIIEAYTTEEVARSL